MSVLPRLSAIMHIFSVRTLAQAVKDVLEGVFLVVRVCGPVVNSSKPLSWYIFSSSHNEVPG